MRFSRTTHLRMYLSLETLMSTMRTGLLFWWNWSTGELYYNFIISNVLTQMVNFPTRICDYDLYKHVVVSVSIGFPSYSQQDASFHRITYDYSRADWDGLCNHLRDVPWEDILNWVLLVLLVNFISGFRLKLIYTSLIESIKSNITHLHGFQLLVLLT